VQASVRMASRTAQHEEEAAEVEAKTCRLCWGDEDDGSLVQPCACRGSAKWIHQHCLEKWRRTSPRVDAAYRCGQCMDHYRDALSIELLGARLQAKRTSGQGTSITLGTLASELQDQGKYDKAEPLFREALEVDRETLGNRHPNTLAAISNLGGLLHAKGDLAAAEPLCREALEVERETLGNRDPSTLASISNLGVVLQAKGDLAAAEPLLCEALEGLRVSLGDRHPHTLNFIDNMKMFERQLAAEVEETQAEAATATATAADSPASRRPPQLGPGGLPPMCLSDDDLNDDGETISTMR
jgi:tetratricopeptide (TPR) repeat protein